jgi:ABC-type cobalamin/Fe3+-siderophores transport system ATPase subunit
MSKALVEFKRFLAKAFGSMPDHEKKLSRLVLDNFAAIEAAGSAGGKRGRLIAKLIEEGGDAISSDYDVVENASLNAEHRVTSLSRIKIQDFRGFSDAQTFDLMKKYTFVYGPNGTGKSSLCEAFEYALLGSVGEADVKRIDVAAYIKNSITGISSAPVLHGIGPDGTEIEVRPDPKSYEFCFIEKNRIDGFARVAANTPAAQQARLAALFGLEEFNVFSTQFNDHFENYLDCVGQKTKALAEKEKQNAGHRQILAQLPEKEKQIAARTETLLSRYPDIKTLGDLKTHISGNENEPGLSGKINSEIARLAALKPVPKPEIEAVLAESRQLIALIEERKEAKQFLVAYKDQLSLRDLYKAILANKERYENTCPACESTVLVGGKLAVPVDPYANAAEKVKMFDKAIKQEARISEIGKLLDSRWPILSPKIDRFPDIAKAVAFPDSAKIAALSDAFGKVENTKMLEEVLAQLAAETATLDLLKESVAVFNGNIEKSKEAARNLEAQARLLVKDLEEIAAINASLKDAASSREAATKAIAKFNEENETLIKQADAEKPVIERNRKYLVAYESFRDKLMKYNVRLPLSMAANLNEKTLKFYNAINKHDHVTDLLTGIALPTASGRKIEIEFEVGKKFDALQILSEGHIRCLGLAILLSKIVRDNLPFLIFDDVVNSIDDEHRAGIIELLLGDDEISRRQLIITTHGEDFVKRLENFVPKAAHKELVNRLDFLVPAEPKKILVKLDTPRHYLVVAERMLQEGRLRDCLSHIRKSFEELLNRLWKRIVNKGYAAQFKLALRGPGAMPDLMSLANGLHEFLSKKEIQIYQDVIPLLQKMLGRETTHPLEWNHLNKGTHEEDRKEEFDAVMVKEMLTLMDELDATIEKGGAAPAKAVSRLPPVGAETDRPIPV